MKIPFPKRSFWLVSLIILIAAGLSLASFLTFNYASANIRSSAINQIHSNAQTEASDMSNIVSQKIEEVITNLQVISASSLIPLQNFTGIDQLLQAAQNSTRESTQAYLWMNATGIPVADSNLTFLSLSKNLSIDAINQPYFVVPMTTGNIYFATNVTSVISGNHYVVISLPLFIDRGQTKTFDGILMASISVTSLGQYVQSQLSSHFQGSVGLLDPSGLILYSSNASSIGKNVFASQFQDSLPASLKQPFDTMLNQSLAGKTGFQDFSYKGASGGLAYQPVIVTINGANGSTIHQQFATLFVAAADILAAAQSSQVSLLGLVSTITILGIATTAGMVSFVVLKRNKRLDELVNEKTADLASALEKERKTRSRAELLQDILAHDIRNHNQVMKLSAELLGEEFAQDPYAKDLVTQLLRSVDGSTQLVENAQKIGKILSQEDTKLHPVDLMKVIEDSMSLVKDAALGDGRTVSDERRGMSSPNNNKDATVLADELLRSVFENIYANAVKYSDSDTVWIETSVEEETQYWKISISDKGKGIEDSRKEGLFTRYVESRKGSGLGLSIVHSLVVERYKGKIEIKNRVPDDYRQGTTFVIRLKIASPQTPQESTSVLKIRHSTSS